MIRYPFTDSYLLSADGYTLDISRTHIGVIFSGVTVARLDVRSAVCSCTDDAEIKDVEAEIADFAEVSFGSAKAVYKWHSVSTLWNKEYTLTAFPDHFEYEVTVRGDGNVDSVNYFSGNVSEPCHGSDYDFAEGYFPAVPLDGSYPYTYAPIKDHAPFSYLTVPPMFIRTFRTELVGSRLALGLVAKLGEHNFTQFDYRTSMDRWGAKFWLSTDQSGHTVVDGEWTAPKIIGYASESDEAAMKKYCDYYFDTGICGRGDAGKKPRFWYGPIACGWLEQLAHCYAGGYGLTDASRQFLYEEMVEKLHKKRLYPTVLIIDDKWQDKYGTAKVNTDKWHDLRGFIDRNREKHGIHTLMWYRMWDSEDIPDEYCVWDEKESRYVVDPSNPGYQAILKENIRRIISDGEGCYNADGLKVDFAFWQPLGRKAKTYSGAYGVELFYQLVKLIRDTMKEIKPDAIMNASPCHPIFADLVDQARLHDYDYRLRSAYEEFSTRASLYRIALPNALIDTDGCGYNTRRDTLRYLTQSKNIGIPDMYAVSDTPYMALTEEEWDKVAKAWEEYSKEI